MTGAKALNKTLRKAAAVETGREGLMAAAERLFAEHGVEDVSMRQIVIAAGQANHYAVQHHFGDKSGLIRAILEARLAEFDAACARALRRAERTGALDAHALVEAMLSPIAQFVDESGRHIYAQFLLRLQHDDPGGVFVMQFYGRMQTNIRISEMLRERLHWLPEHIFVLRLRLAANLFLQSAAGLDVPEILNGMAPNVYLKHVTEACVSILLGPEREPAEAS
jgi:AcrR family transcriptional regulator